MLGKKSNDYFKYYFFSVYDTLLMFDISKEIIDLLNIYYLSALGLKLIISCFNFRKLKIQKYFVMIKTKISFGRN